MTTFGSDSPDIADAVWEARRRARAKARQLQQWTAQILDVSPPNETEEEPNDGESATSS